METAMETLLIAKGLSGNDPENGRELEEGRITLSLVQETRPGSGERTVRS